MPTMSSHRISPDQAFILKLPVELLDRIIGAAVPTIRGWIHKSYQLYEMAALPLSCVPTLPPYCFAISVRRRDGPQ